MQSFMVTLWTMSWQSGIVIAVVLILRKLFEKLRISKKYMMLLWIVPYLCLVCPWKISMPKGFWKAAPVEIAMGIKEEGESLLSLDGRETEKEESLDRNKLSVSVVEKTDVGGEGLDDEGKVSGYSGETMERPAMVDEKTKFQSGVIHVLGLIWAAGLFILFIYNAISYLKLKRKLLCSVKISQEVYMGDEVAAPMVVGMIRPRIYLPTNLPEEYHKYVLAHEKTHIRRWDTVYKMIVYGITCIYWFHPLVWAAFYFFSKDMEMTCDEETVRMIGMEEREAYARALLGAASGKVLRNRIIFVAPVAFEEGNVKSRIKNIMRYKKTVTVVAVCAVLICVLAAGIFMTKEETVDGEKVKEEIKEETKKEKESTEEKADLQDYMEFIEQIKEGMADDFQSISTDQLNISPVFHDETVIENGTLWYYFIDLDSDGIDEMLFGIQNRWSGRYQIFDIYTMKNDTIIHVASGSDMEHNYFKLCENGRIIHENFSGRMMDGYRAYYTYEDGSLQFIESFISENGKWYHNQEDVTLEKATATTTEKVLETMKSEIYEIQDLIEYIPFIENAKQPEYKDQENLSFEDLRDIEFMFSSGAGGWGTIVTINEDGSFVGCYQDGNTGSGYYYKDQRYECNFSGQFSAMIKTGPYEYTIQCESLELQQEPGTEAIIDESLVIYSDPYGFDHAGEFKLYLPGKKASELPAGFLSWSHEKAESGSLDCYGLYNVGGKQGFVVWEYSNRTYSNNPSEEEQSQETEKPNQTIENSLSEEKIAKMQAQNYPVTEDLTFQDLSHISNFTAKSALTGVFGATIIFEEDGSFHSFNEKQRGRFSSLRRTGPYEYTLQLEYLEGVEMGELIDGTEKKVYTDPAGFEYADQFILYLPGKRYDELPEELLTMLGERGLFLDNYILYNVQGKEGFVVIPG